MNYLIFTQPDDVHACAVSLALTSLGHQVRLLFGADQPTQLLHSVLIDATRSEWCSSQFSNPAVEQYDVIWYRRARYPFIPKTCVHEKDYKFAYRENRIFFDSLVSLLSLQAWWVNPPLMAKQALSKIYQLQCAKAVGLTIPPTLCSNNPQDIRAFINKYKSQGVIYKPLCGDIWIEGQQVKTIYTTEVQADQLHDEVLQLTPGLFQPRIQKHYELRITCFGTSFVAARINTPIQGIGQFDWRAEASESLVISPEALSPSLIKKLTALMQSLGLMFGCIDMIVTPEGEMIFLEINEQGQFLWLEDSVPELYLLDHFIQFVTKRSFYFKWDPKACTHLLSHYDTALPKAWEAQFKSHVAVDSI